MKDVTEKRIQIFKEDIIEFLQERLSGITEDADVHFCFDSQMHYMRSEDECSDENDCIVVRYYETDDDDGCVP